MLLHQITMSLTGLNANVDRAICLDLENKIAEEVRFGKIMDMILNSSVQLYVVQSDSR